MVSRRLCRRSDAEGLQKLVDGIESNGGTASGHMLNAVEEGAIEKLVEEVEQIGPIEVVLSTWVHRSGTDHREHRTKNL